MSALAPMKLAIVGGGPSAFFAASRLLSLLPTTSAATPPMRIHMFDRLWAPHGLVRYGVAPDHPEVKNCTNKFDAAAADPRLRFFGNVNIGERPPFNTDGISIPLSSLTSNYTHLLLANGCTLPKLHPDLPPSDVCMPALSLVHWYTQHPAAPPPPPLHKITHVTLIGNGNVSLDVARILLSEPSVLAPYDLPQHVLDVLATSTVRHVSIVARRGPLDAAFTAKEVREMMHLTQASMVPIEPRFMEIPEGTKLSRQQTRLMDLLRKGSQNAHGSTPKSWSLEFFAKPTGMISGSSGTSITFEDTYPMGTERAPLTWSTPSAELSSEGKQSYSLPTSLVIPSLGFQGEPDMPFYLKDWKHTHAPGGRVSDASTGEILRSVYASGWTANGAKGVLATTMMDAYGVAATIIQELVTADEANTPIMNATPKDFEEPPQEVIDGLKAGVVTQYEDWKKVDEEEVRRGQLKDGKERERMGWEDAREFLALIRTT